MQHAALRSDGTPKLTALPLRAPMPQSTACCWPPLVPSCSGGWRAALLPASCWPRSTLQRPTRSRRCGRLIVGQVQGRGALISRGMQPWDCRCSPASAGRAVAAVCPACAASWKPCRRPVAGVADPRSLSPATRLAWPQVASIGVADTARSTVVRTVEQQASSARPAPQQLSSHSAHGQALKLQGWTATHACSSATDSPETLLSPVLWSAPAGCA